MGGRAVADRFRSPLPARAVLAVLAAGLLAVLAAGLLAVLAAHTTPAEAHAFLVDSRPEHGDVLVDPPRSVELEATEPLSDVVVLEVRGRGGTVADAGIAELRDGGYVAHLALAEELGDGVYTVAWHVVSAVDGHETAGEFVFGVGEVDAALGATQASGVGSVGWSSRVAVGWIYFVGLAAAGGALVAELLFERRLPVATRRWARVGLLIALVAIAGRLGSDGAVTAVPLAVGAVALAAALLGVAVLRRPWPGLGGLLVSVAAWASASHLAVERGLAGIVVDIVHLGTGSLWAGALAVVAVAWWRARNVDRTALREGTWRYARLAALLVVLLAASGAVAAIELLDGLSDLWETGYGRLILVKTALLLTAVGFAFTARTRGLPAHRPGRLRRAVTAEGATLALALGVGAVVAASPPPVGTGDTAEIRLGPAPFQGPVARDAGLAGQITTRVAAGDGRLDVEVYVPSGPLDATVDVAVTLPDGRAVDLEPRPCGTGCLTQQLEIPSGTTAVEIRADAHGWGGGRYVTTVVWPPPPEQPELLERTLTVMGEVAELYLAEHVWSGPHPDRPDEDPPGFPARPDDPSQATRLSGPQLLEIDPYGRGRAADVRPLPQAVAGFTFHLPGSRIHGTVWLDDADRIDRLRMVTPGHEILRTFAYPEDVAQVD